MNFKVCLVLTASILFVVACTKKKEATPLTGQLSEQLVLALSGGVDPNETKVATQDSLKWLKAMEGEFTPEQAEWAKRARALLTEKPPEKPELGADYLGRVHRYIELMEQTENLFPKEAYLRAESLKALYFMAHLSKDTEARTQEIKTKATALIKQFPEVDRVHKINGWLHMSTLEGVASFHRCVELNPQEKECRDLHASSVAAYEVPACKKMKKIEFFVAHEDPAQGRNPLKWEDTTYYHEAKPFLTEKNLVEVRLSQAANYGGSESPPQVSFQFKNSALPMLQQTTKSNIGKYLLLRVSGKAYSIPRILGELTSPIAQLQFTENDKSLDVFCDKVETKKVPPTLAQLPK